MASFMPTEWFLICCFMLMNLYIHEIFHSFSMLDCCAFCVVMFVSILYIIRFASLCSYSYVDRCCCVHCRHQFHCWRRRWMHIIVTCVFPVSCIFTHAQRWKSHRQCVQTAEGGRERIFILSHLTTYETSHLRDCFGAHIWNAVHWMYKVQRTVSHHCYAKCYVDISQIEPKWFSLWMKTVQ